jgi:hypothetical protein
VIAARGGCGGDHGHPYRLGELDRESTDRTMHRPGSVPSCLDRVRQPHAAVSRNESSQEFRFVRISVIKSVENSIIVQGMIQVGRRPRPKSDQYWLSEAQLERIIPYFPLSHGRPRLDDRRVISGIVHVIRNGLE